MYLVFLAAVVTFTALIPLWAPKIAAHYKLAVHAAPLWLPILAAVCFGVAPLLPDVHISAQTNSFQEHFFGGGIYTALLYIYFTRLFGWRRHWVVALLALFAWTSALGVANELLEFALVKLNITYIDITDTSWDLVANTVGSLLTYTLLLPFLRQKRD